jgi:hypothetical protein
MGETWTSSGRAWTFIWESGWRIVPADDATPGIQEVDVHLELQGDEGEGYILLMTPDRGFTADDWFLRRLTRRQ